jgi:predicted metal-dependent hydrolase
MTERFSEPELLAVPTSEGMELMTVMIRYSRRARNLRLTLGEHGEAKLTIPRHCSRQTGIDFLNKQGDWIKKHQPRLRKQRQPGALLNFLQKQGWISACGEKSALEIEFGGKSACEMHEGWKKVKLELVQSEDVDALLVKMLNCIAREVLPFWTFELAEKLSLRVSKIGVRDQKSRWGSCSELGNVSLNWRLLLLKPELQTYIILHELAHLSEMNHSEKFWKLLETYDPAARLHDREVTKVSRELMVLGR